jgi:hypothetical protein
MVMNSPEKQCLQLFPCYMACVAENVIGTTAAKISKYINKNVTGCNPTNIASELTQFNGTYEKCTIY